MFKEILITTPISIVVVSLISWIISKNSVYLLFCILSILVFLLNLIEKIVAKKLMGLNSTTGKRPSGCGNKTGKNCTGCGIYSEYGKISRTWGMPSGHAQYMAFVVVFWLLFNPKRKCNLFLVILWIMVCIQRVESKCHSTLQVLVGSLIGSLLGLLSYYLTKKLKLV